MYTEYPQRNVSLFGLWLGSSTGKMAKKQNLEEHAHGLSIEKNGKETAAPGAMLT